MTVESRRERWRRGATQSPASGKSQREVQRLWSLVAPEKDVRAHTLHEDLGRTAARVAGLYRWAGMGSRRERIRGRIQALFDARDDESAGPWARCTLLPSPVPEMRMSVWELPPGSAANPYRHPFAGEEVLVVVLDGRAALHGAEEAHDLEKNQAVVVRRPSGGELLNYTGKRVRFLALRAAGERTLLG
jgi:hypothetical protein